MLIGVVGSIASGKDTFAEYLEKRGFVNVSLSAMLREIMSKERESLDVMNLTRYGNQLRNTKGFGFLASEALKKIGDRNAVVTSIRQVGEVEVLIKRQDFTLIKTDAPIEMRFSRLQKRSRAGDPKNLEELKQIEKMQAGGQSGGMNVDACMELADAKIINDGSVEEFYKKIDDFMVKVEKNESVR